DRKFDAKECGETVPELDGADRIESIVDKGFRLIIDLNPDNLFGGGTDLSMNGVRGGVADRQQKALRSTSFLLSPELLEARDLVVEAPPLQALSQRIALNFSARCLRDGRNGDDVVDVEADRPEDVRPETRCDREEILDAP